MTKSPDTTWIFVALVWKSFGNTFANAFIEINNNVLLVAEDKILDTTLANNLLFSESLIPSFTTAKSGLKNSSPFDMTRFSVTSTELIVASTSPNCMYLPPSSVVISIVIVSLFIVPLNLFLSDESLVITIIPTTSSLLFIVPDDSLTSVLSLCNFIPVTEEVLLIVPLFVNILLLSDNNIPKPPPVLLLVIVPELLNIF